MADQHSRKDFTGRLDDYIRLARSGKTIQLQTRLHRRWVKQVNHGGASDNLEIETDHCLFMVDFWPIQVEAEMPKKVTKSYMISPANESEVDAKTTCHIANERLRMDYERLKQAGISVEENFF